MSFGGLGALVTGFSRLGSAGRHGTGVTAPTAPVLAMDPVWTTADNTPDFTIDIDDTVVAGDTVRLQIQATGGNWSSPVSDTTHTITSPEDTANAISLSLTPLPNATYDARALVYHNSDSGW